MKTIVSVSACWVLFVFIHVEAVTDGDLQSVLARLSVLEEKQEFSEKRIAALETENKMSHKRIVDLEKYKTLSDRRVAALERKNSLFKRINYALDIVKKLYSQNAALETDKILLDKTTTTNGYDKALFDREIASLEKDKILSDIKIVTPENDSTVSPNRDGEKERHTAAVEIANQSTAGNILNFEQRRFVAEGIVAFSAMKAARQDHIGLNQNIIFEQVLTNEGGGYHANHGIFIAPQSGVYVFSSSILCVQNGQFNAEIVHNGNVISRLYARGEAGKNDQGSQTVVIKMNAGDEVAVRSIDVPDNSVGGYLYSSFSGYLALMQ